MASITEITINGKNIKEHKGKIYIDGRDIDTGKYKGMDIGFSMCLGFVFGVALFPFLLMLYKIITDVMG